MEYEGKYLFKVIIDEEEFCVFASNMLEAFSIASNEVDDYSDTFYLEVKMLCFENEIINIKDIINK